jgi:hypothetical protein
MKPDSSGERLKKTLIFSGEAGYAITAKLPKPVRESGGRIVVDQLIDFSHIPELDSAGKQIEELDPTIYGRGRMNKTFVEALGKSNSIIYDEQGIEVWVQVSGDIGSTNESDWVGMYEVDFRQIYGNVGGDIALVAALSGKDVQFIDSVSNNKTIKARQTRHDSWLKKGISTIGDNNLDIIGTIDFPLHRDELVNKVEPIVDDVRTVLVDCLPDFDNPPDTDSLGNKLAPDEKTFLAGLNEKCVIAYDIANNQFEYFTDNQTLGEPTIWHSMSHTRLQEIYGSKGDFIITMAVSGLQIYPRYDHQNHKEKPELELMTQQAMEKVELCKERLHKKSPNNVGHVKYISL